MGKRAKPCLEKIFYVYSHIRKDTMEIFYIGKGKGGRSKSKSGRSDKWRSIVNSVGYEVKILADNLTEPEAFRIERYMIEKHRENLCNRASGGQGAAGVVHTKATKDKWRKAKLGKKQMPEHAKKSAVARIGAKNSPEHIEATVSHKRKPVINSDGELFNSASEAARVFSNRLSRKCSQGNISMCARGERAQAYGKTWSYETKTHRI